jgi:hypothetical protein
MDCVYHAYADYLEYMDINPTRCDYLYYKLLKQWTHGSKPQYTFGGVAPWIVGKIAGLHSLSYSDAFYRVYTPEHFIEIARKYYKPYFRRICNAINKTNWGEVKEIYGTPGIYFLLTGQHAIFSTQVPQFGKPIMLIQMWKE